jgi:hypothetical protein
MKIRVMAGRGGKTLRSSYRSRAVTGEPKEDRKPPNRDISHQSHGSRASQRHLVIERS